MKTLYIGLLIVAIFSCKPSQPTSTDECLVSGYTLRLSQEGNSATLQVDGPNAVVQGTIKLEAPCYFVRMNGEVQTFGYEDVKVDKVLIITGNLADAELKKKFGAPLDGICGQKAQGILMKGNEIIITDYVQGDGMFCKDAGLDEKDFWDFAHNNK